MTTGIKAAMRQRFCPPEWALFFEVGDATGGRHKRWADAVAMNLYPSRGLAICGFEFKVSRGDWLRELKDPAKSAPVQQYCNTWAIVTPPGLVKDGELPPTWGLYELDPGGKLRQKVASPTLQHIPVTREFVAAMLRRASEVDHGEVRKLVDIEVTRQRAQDTSNNQREIERRTQNIGPVMKRIEEIKSLCGIDLMYGYEDVNALARAFRLARDTGLAKDYSSLESTAWELERTAKRIRDAVAAFALPADQPVAAATPETL